MIALVAVALVALQTPTPALPGPGPQSATPAYELLAEQYLRGQYDAAVAETARHPATAFTEPFEQAYRKLLDRVKFEIVAVKRTGTLTADLDSLGGPRRRLYQSEEVLARFLLGVMLLHTEAALSARQDDIEGHIAIARTANVHLDDVIAFLKKSATGPEPLTGERVESFRHDWAVLSALVYNTRGQLGELGGFLKEAFRRYPRDPALALCLAVYYERAALFGSVDVSLMKDIYSADHVAHWRQQHELAIMALRETIRDRELRVEAQLRTGRIRTLLGDFRGARSVLEPLTRPSSPLMIRYFAVMTLGRADEADGQLVSAESRYKEAAQLYPTAQAPFAALSRLRDAQGDGGGAREWLEHSLALNGSRRIDPWWWYYGPFIDRETLIDTLRGRLGQ